MNDMYMHYRAWPSRFIQYYNTMNDMYLYSHSKRIQILSGGQTVGMEGVELRQFITQQQESVEEREIENASAAEA